MVLGANIDRKSHPGASCGVLALFLASFAMAQEQGAYNSACFRGIVDADSPAVLSPCDAQDALNVESNLTGTAILKRKGYQVVSSLTVATGPVTGSHSFIDASGNRQDIVCHDRYCAKSTNGNAFTNFLSTAGGSGAIPTWWSFVDSGGVLYGANSRRDPILSYDGTTLSYPSGMPSGALLEMTQDRMVAGDIQGQPNRVWYSSAGAVTQFTLGVNTEDSYYDDIGSAGDRVRGLKYSNGILYIFKSASITGCELGDQYSSRCAVMSTNIGTTDGGSIVAAGSSIYFRAQDKNYWEISENRLRQISSKIPNFVKSQSGGPSGGEQSNTQTSQADWRAGTQGPSGSWDTASVNGAILPSSTTLNDSTVNNFNLGSFTGSGVSISTSLQVSGVTSTYTFRYDATVLPDDLSDSGGWTKTQSPTSYTVSGSSLTVYNSGATAGKFYRSYTATSGASQSFVFRAALKAVTDATNSGYAVFRIANSGDNEFAEVHISTRDISYWSSTSQLGYELLAQPSYSTYTVIISSLSAYFYRDGIFKSSGTITVTGTSNRAEFNGLPFGSMFLDLFHVSSGITLPLTSDIPAISTFTSRIYDAGTSNANTGPFLSTVTTPSGTAITYQVRSSTSPNNDLWSNYVPVVPPARPQTTTGRYWQYKVTLAHGNLTESPGITGINLALASTGYFYTQCIQPNSSISGWGTLSCAETKTGAGSLVYYATSAATCASLPATDPSTWQTTLTNNATVTIATNTAVAVGFRSLLGSATDQAQVDSCILNWNEGAATQQAWGVYDSIKNAVYWTMTINNATSANRLLKYDRNLEAWYPFSIAAQAPRVINNSLYFGGSSAGTWNLYGGVDADAGSAINAYWKSKDIGSDAPFQEKSFDRLSILSRNNGTGDMTATYTYSNAETGNYTISLSTGLGIVYARSNFNLPITSPQVFVNVQVGNNSSTPFEVLGMGLTWSILPWAVNP